MFGKELLLNASFKEGFTTIVDIYYDGDTFFSLYIRKEGEYASEIGCAGNGMHVKRTFNNLIERVGDVVECWYTSQFYNLINATSSGATKIGGTGKYESPLRFRITDKTSSLEFRFKKK